MIQEKHFKRYGQIFLKNRAIAALEARSLDIPSGSTVIEIGPGNGILTAELLKLGFMVTAVETDHRFVDNLKLKFKEEISSGQLTVIKQNFMKFEAGEIDGIAGNIPYGLSSSIVEKLAGMDFECAVMMFQKEFAERLFIKPGHRGFSRISALSYLNFEVKKIKDVSSKNFYPKPEVDSTILHLKKKQFIEYGCISREISKLFSDKRKKLKNVLKCVPQEVADLRIEQLSEDQFLMMVKRIVSKNTHDQNVH